IKGLVKDDDEDDRDTASPDEDVEESNGSRSAGRTPTLPRTSPRTWYKVQTDIASGKIIESALAHPLAAAMFERVTWSDRLLVTQFCYGLARGYGLQIEAPALYYANRALGR